MDQSNRREGSSSAPHSPQHKFTAPSFSKPSSRPVEDSTLRSIESSNYQTAAGLGKKLAPALGRASFRTAPSSPARQQPPSPHTKTSKNKILSSKNANEFSPRSLDGNDQHDRRSFERPPRSALSEKAKKTKPQTPQQQHRKRNSDESGTVGSDYLPYIEEDALSNASSLDQLGPLFLKLASTMHLSGENPHKALECASRAAKFLERATCGRPSMELIMSLHTLAAIHCRLGQWEAAIPVLQRAVSVPFHADNVDHARAAFAGHMQLGDALVMLGQQSSALASYNRAYNIQMRVLGDMNPQVGETCSYLAEAHLQALQFEEAAQFCSRALLIHNEHRKPGSIEEAMDRLLMGLILSGKGDYESALEHLVLANVTLTANSRDADVAAVDSTIGDLYVALGRYDEAVFSYQKALKVFKSMYGEGHTKVAAVYVSLAEQYMKTGKHREAKTHSESALRIYGRQNAGHAEIDLAMGLIEIASVYESMGEREQALMFLQRALDILEGLPGHQNVVAGIEGQMGVLYYILGRYEEAFMAFKNAVSKLRGAGEGRSLVLGILLNQMGLSCVGLNEIWHAADMFEEAKIIFEEILGSDHADTLAVASNLAGAYDALGRWVEAIDLLESILEVKEGRLGTVHPEVEEERHRLMQLLKEAGRDRVRRTNTLEELLLLNSIQLHRDPLLMKLSPS